MKRRFSLFFFFQARHHLSAGDYEGAKIAAKTARYHALAAIVTGVMSMLLVIIMEYS